MPLEMACDAKINFPNRLILFNRQGIYFLSFILFSFLNYLPQEPDSGQLPTVNNAIYSLKFIKTF